MPRKPTPAWLLAARKGGTNRQDPQLLLSIRDGPPEEAWIAAAQVDVKWKMCGQTAMYFAAAREDSMDAEQICRFLRSRFRNAPLTTKDDWQQSPLFYAARQGHTELCAFFVETCGMDVNQVDYCNETPIFYAVQSNKLETVIYLLKCGASLGINNSSLESPESLASVEMARDLRARIEEWGEPSQPTTPSKKRKRREEDEPSAAEGPRAFENWVAKRARLPKSNKSNAKKEKPKPQAPEVVAENATHQIELIREEFLEQVRELEKGLVTDQVGLFKTQLFVRACRSADYCAALGAYATDSDFFKQYSNIIERRGTFGSLVLVAVDKSSGRVVGFCHADAGNNELLIGHLKVHSEHQQKGVGKLLMAAAETKALSSGWAFESVAVRVLHVNSRAQQIFFRMGFDIRDEPAPETTISLLSMCIKMVRRAQHVPEATMKTPPPPERPEKVPESTEKAPENSEKAPEGSEKVEKVPETSEKVPEGPEKAPV